MSIESLLQRADFVGLGEQEVEEGNNSAFELCALLSPDGDRGETLPEDHFADVRRDEQTDAAAETVAFLQQFIKEQHDQTSDGELSHD